jgi:hypothetical protein
MVSTCKWLSLMLLLSGCGGECIRNTDCKRGERCLSSMCQGPSGGGSAGTAGTGATPAAGSGGTGGMSGDSAAGTGGDSGTGGTGP